MSPENKMRLRGDLHKNRPKTGETLVVVQGNYRGGVYLPILLWFLSALFVVLIA